MHKCSPPYTISSRLCLDLAAVTLLSSVILSFLPDASALAKGLPVISGRITDSSGKPIKSASVRLWLEDMGLKNSCMSDATGNFEIEHAPCKSCSLEVVPIKNKDFASCLIERIPGDTTRKIIVELQKGFLVRGRVVHNGKGLRGIAIRVYAEGKDECGSYVHGGGTTTTENDGSYTLTLTPGPKALVALNKRYQKLAPQAVGKFTVLSPLTLKDIVIPEVN